MSPAQLEKFIPKVLTLESALSLGIKYQSGATLHFNPGTRYLVSDSVVEFILSAQGHLASVLECESFNTLPTYASVPGLSEISWKDKRVLFMSLSIGTGDQLIATAIPRYFRRVLGARPYFCCYEFSTRVWDRNPYLCSAPIRPPIALESVWQPDGKEPFFYRSFFFTNTFGASGIEQENVYDVFFRMTGVDPRSVAEEYKHPIFDLKLSDSEAWTELWGERPPYILVQPFASLQSGKERSFPHELLHRTLSAASRYARENGMVVAVIHDAAFDPEIKKLIDNAKAVDLGGKTPELGVYAAAIAQAQLLIAPDSSALHFAATFSTRVVGLWGLFHPDCRAKYYRRQVHLYHEDPSIDRYSKTKGQYLEISKEAYSRIQTEEIFEAITRAFAL
jgi:hypothetical protein